MSIILIISAFVNIFLLRWVMRLRDERDDLKFKLDVSTRDPYEEERGGGC